MLGAGCFWGVEHELKKLDGIHDVSVGYAGGTTKNPSYQQVCTGDTGHAEVALVEYDPNTVNLDLILEKFWEIHDPTSLNKQGVDIGTQYRSAIYYFDDDQKTTIESSLHKQAEKAQKKIVTEVKKLQEFWKAEEYHQCYLEKQK